MLSVWGECDGVVSGVVVGCGGDGDGLRDVPVVGRERDAVLIAGAAGIGVHAEIGTRLAGDRDRDGPAPALP